MAPCERVTFEECLDKLALLNATTAQDANVLCVDKHDIWISTISSATVAIIIYLLSTFSVQCETIDQRQCQCHRQRQWKHDVDKLRVLWCCMCGTIIILFLSIVTMTVTHFVMYVCVCVSFSIFLFIFSLVFPLQFFFLTCVILHYATYDPFLYFSFFPFVSITFHIYIYIYAYINSIYILLYM